MPKRSPDEVYQVAKAVEAKVMPRSGSTVGELRNVIEQRVRSCLDTVKGDITKSCTAGDQYAGSGSPPQGELAAESTKQYAQLAAYLDDQKKTSSILPMSYRYAGDAVVYKNAQGLCDDYADELNYQLQQQGTDLRVSYRVPTKAEAMLLAPLVGYGAIDWSGADFANRIWYGPQNDCGINYPYFENQSTASSSTTGCMTNDYWDDDLAVVCVPANGPVPVLDAQ
jgi:hypothetical protein